VRRDRPPPQELGNDEIIEVGRYRLAAEEILQPVDGMPEQNHAPLRQVVKRCIPLGH